MKSYVYVLVLKDHSMLKIGKADNVYSRMTMLEKLWGEFDLEKSFVYECKNEYVNKLERLFHAALYDFNIENLEDKDGYTEFFAMESISFIKGIAEVLMKTKRDIVKKSLKEILPNVKEVKRNQPYKLINTKFKMSALTLDMFYLLLTEVTNKDMRYCNFSHRDLEIRLGKQINRNCINIALEELKVTNIEIKREKKEPIYLNVCASSKETEKGFYNLEISSELKTYILSTDDTFLLSLTDFNQLKKISSSYGKRIYSLLKQHENKKNKGWYKVSVAELKDMLEVSIKYQKYSDFKKRVLNTALKHINESTNMTVDMVELKKGKFVTSLSFTFRSLKEKKRTVKNIYQK